MNDFLLDLLIHVYHLLPQLSLPPSLSVVEWASFSVKVLLLIKEEVCQIRKGNKLCFWFLEQNNHLPQHSLCAPEDSGMGQAKTKLLSWETLERH